MTKEWSIRYVRLNTDDFNDVVPFILDEQTKTRLWTGHATWSTFAAIAEAEAWAEENLQRWTTTERVDSESKAGER